MDTDQPEPDHRVTPLELFFDLVFVFAFTQVTTFFSRYPTWGGLLRGLLILAVLWWAWSSYAWLTNTFDPEEGVVRLVVLSAAAAMVVASLAVPGAFGADGVVFGVAYLVVRGLHLVLFTIAGRGDRDLVRAVLRIVPGALLAAALLIVAGFLHGSAQLAVWLVAIVVIYGGALLGHMQGWRVSPAHFVERFGLVIIIALGESIAAVGVAARKLPLDAEVIVAALLGFIVAASLWWSYFDWFAYVARSRLADATGERRARLARDGFSYLHLPMVAGIFMFAFGLKTVLPDASRSLPAVPAFALYGGIAVYLLAHVALRLRVGGGLGRGRPIAAILLLALLPVAMNVPALAALGLETAVGVGLIAYEFFRRRESRAFIRSHEGAVGRQDEERLYAQESRRRSRRAEDDPPVEAR
jgi:low temperature requirement protein LtrA